MSIQRQPKTRSKAKPGQQLARPGDPLVTADGKVIDPEGYHKGHEIPEGMSVEKRSIDPPNYKPVKKRNIAELPAEKTLMNAISVVFMYTLMGVGDREIADNLRTNVEEINWLRHHAAYVECFNSILSEFINANSDLLAARVASYANTAVHTIGTLVSEGKKEETRLRASTDILDRAGVTKKDIADKNVVRHDLRIIIVDGDEDNKRGFDVTLEDS